MRVDWYCSTRQPASAAPQHQYSGKGSGRLHARQHQVQGYASQIVRRPAISVDVDFDFPSGIKACSTFVAFPKLGHKKTVLKNYGRGGVVQYARALSLPPPLALVLSWHVHGALLPPSLRHDMQLVPVMSSYWKGGLLHAGLHARLPTSGPRVALVRAELRLEPSSAKVWHLWPITLDRHFPDRNIEIPRQALGRSKRRLFPAQEQNAPRGHLFVCSNYPS